MSTNWKRLTFGAIMLASLTLFLFGCGGGSGTPEAPALKQVSGVVAAPATGQPLANATVTAYAIGANGVVATTPLSMPATARSDAQGNYSLSIPAGYAGSVMIVATLPDGSQSVRTVIPSVAPDQTVIPAAMVSLATEMMVQFIIQNNAGSFTPANLQAAILVLEPFFGPNFPQIPPPATGSAPSTLQQNLLTITQAIDALLNPPAGQTGYTMSQLVSIVGGNISLGQGVVFTDLNTAIATIATNLIISGVVPGSYTPPVITPIPVPPPGTDTTPPAAPANLTATATASTVTLSWDPALAADGVTAYFIYRNGALFATVTAPATTYVDSGLAADTPFTYEVRARDAAGNLSSASAPVSVRTSTIPTFTISGTVTVDGVKPSAGLVVGITITGAGFGIAFTDADGNYTFSGARPGSYTITPVLQGFLFTPASQAVTITNADVTGVNFATVTPPGTVIGGITYPPGTVIGSVTYPTAVVIGGVTYPAGTVISFIAYPNATVIGGVTYPSGTVISSVGFPNAAVIGGITYPSGTVLGGTTYPTGTVVGGITYPDGVVIGGVTYPPGTVVGGIAFPPGAVVSGVSYPSGTIIGQVLYPGTTVIGGANYPAGSVSGTPVFPDALTAITVTITFPP